MTTRVLAIDQGTSATKAVIATSDGALVDVDSAVAGIRYDDDAVEQDPEALLDSILTAGRTALAASGDSVAAVGLGNQGETVLAWDIRDGRPLSPAISWQDRRASAITDALDPRTRDALLRLTGLPADPYFAAPKMAWLRRRLGGALGRTTAITTIDAWTNFRLTGRFATDAATASRTMLLDPETLDWSPEAIAAFGLEDLPMPEVIACDARLGTTSAFGPSIAVIGAIVDQQAALLAEGCLAEGDAKCTYGTGAFLLANVGTRHAPSAAGLATSLAWAMSNGDRASCVDGQVYTVGAAVSWLERIGLIDSPADLDRLGGSVASTGGVICVPALAGVGAPTWRPDARATWQGLSLATSREHMVRAFCEGVAAQVALLAAAAADDIGAPLASLRVDGGLTRSRVVMQLQADLLGVPVEVYPHTCATALGVAALALRGLEGPGAEDDLVKGWGPAATYVPTVSADEASARVRAFAAALEAS